MVKNSDDSAWTTQTKKEDAHTLRLRVRLELTFALALALALALAFGFGFAFALAFALALVTLLPLACRPKAAASMLLLRGGLADTVDVDVDSKGVEDDWCFRLGVTDPALDSEQEFEAGEGRGDPFFIHRSKLPCAFVPLREPHILHEGVLASETSLLFAYVQQPHFHATKCLWDALAFGIGFGFDFGSGFCFWL